MSEECEAPTLSSGSIRCRLLELFLFHDIYLNGRGTKCVCNTKPHTFRGKKNFVTDDFRVNIRN